MVNPGGNLTMLGQWRIVIKQAEDAARAGRFDEALALITRPDADKPVPPASPLPILPNDPLVPPLPGVIPPPVQSK
jgi:hypothetical protein